MILSYDLTIPATECSSALKAFDPALLILDVMHGWVQRKPAIRHGFEAPIFRHGVGTPIYGLARWGYAVEDGSVRPEMAHSKLSAELLCIVPASFVDIRCDKAETANSAPLTIRVGVEGATWFWIAGIWQRSGILGPQSFAMLTRPSGEDIQPFAAKQPWILGGEEWIDLLRSAKDARPRPRHSPKGALRIEKLATHAAAQ